MKKEQKQYGVQLTAKAHAALRSVRSMKMGALASLAILDYVARMETK